MAKRKRLSKTEKWIKEGRGCGTGSEYKPWLNIQNVSSSGRSTRFKGNKTKREHHLLSDMERDYFYLVDFADCTIDIREQFPLLPLEQTLVIAKELGIKHPINPKNHEPVVMTTDFIVTIQTPNGQKDIARTIKPKDELLKKRVIEKFEIERVYWLRKGIDWGIVTEEEINKTMAKNISYFHEYHNLKKYDAFEILNEEQIEELSLLLIKYLQSTNRTIREITNQFDLDTHLPFGSGITLFYHLLAKKIVNIDLTQKLNLDKQIVISIINESLFRKVKYG